MTDDRPDVGTARLGPVPTPRIGPLHPTTTRAPARVLKWTIASRQFTPAKASLYQEWITNQRELQHVIGETERASAKAGEILLRQINRVTTS